MINRWNDGFSVKFYLGIFMIIGSFVLGGLIKVVFLVYFFDKFLRGVSIILYIISWFMLGIGVWWAGREAYNGIRRYMDYKFYHESIKTGTRKAYQRGQIMKKHVKRRVAEEKARMNKIYIERKFRNKK
jgi:high-affinity Fe2+/Pb2+ permease